MSTFVEVGTCDFDTCEKLIKNGWSGIVIEPVKYYFDKLPKYPNIKYENIAISDNKDESSIHYLDPEIITNESQSWMKGISSIRGETGPLSLNTDTLQNICDKYNVTSIDFLKIDTEGHDIKVLESLDLDKVYVKMIKIEHQHVDKEYLKNHLQNNNYLVYEEYDDIYAIK